jgi:hypothetical protein
VRTTAESAKSLFLCRWCFQLANHFVQVAKAGFASHRPKKSAGRLEGNPEWAKARELEALGSFALVLIVFWVMIRLKVLRLNSKA